MDGPGLILPGGVVRGYVENVDRRLLSSSVVLVANSAYLSLVIPTETLLIPGITVRHPAVAGNMDAGIYTKTNSTTWTKQTSSGSVANAATLQTYAFTPYLAAIGVPIWLTIQPSDGTTLTLLRSAGTVEANALDDYNLSKAIGSFGLPATITSPVGEPITPWMRGG